MSNARPDPDALLARVKADEAERQRGWLKIFFGMAPGDPSTLRLNLGLDTAWWMNSAALFWAF